MTSQNHHKISDEEAVAFGGNLWIRDHMCRVYLSDDVWTRAAGLHIGYYNTGNVSSARLDGETIPNSRANDLLAHKVYVEDGLVHVKRLGGRRAYLSPTEIAQRVTDAILARRSIAMVSE